MSPDAERVELTESQAACLFAVKGGRDAKTKIAIETKQDLKTVTKALEKLSRDRLIRRAGTRRWGATEHGQNCDVRIVPNAERRLGGKAFGRLVPGSTADRLLNALDRPRRGTDLVERFGVTPQRIHQLIVKLYAQGKVRFGDQRKILHIVARSDDPSLLLTQDEERILSALPDDAATTVPRLAAAAHMMSAGANKAVVDLREKGLVEESGSGGGQIHYRLSAEGRAHFQRRASGQRAKPVPLKVRSDRVRSVLSYLAEGERARIKDVRDALGIPHASINALMQYLKRKALVRKSGRELSAPYELTEEGHDALREMLRSDLS